MLIKQARASGVARHIGRGLNVWSHLHIDDLAELYLLALTRAPPGSLFYAENGESSMKAAVEAISRMLGLGGITHAWPIADAVQVLGPSAHLSFGSNSRIRACKARAMLEWQPKATGLFGQSKSARLPSGVSLVVATSTHGANGVIVPKTLNVLQTQNARHQS